MYGYVNCALRGLCVCIRLLRFNWLVRTYTASRFLRRLGYSVFRICRFVQRTDDLILRFVNLSDVCVNVVMECLEEPSEGCDIQGSSADDLYVLIGMSCGYFFWVPSRSLFDVFNVIQHLNLTLDRLLLSNTITRCSNITVHYASSV